MIKDKNVDPTADLPLKIVNFTHKAQIAADVTAGCYGAWIAPFDGKIISIIGWIGSKGGSAEASITIKKGATLAAAATVQSAALDLTSDALLTAVLSTTAATIAFSEGDALFLTATTGSGTTIDALAVTITVKPKTGPELFGY